MPATSRTTFQQLSIERIGEARALLSQGLFSGAYYLAGYSLECAIKVVICGSFTGNELPDKKKVEAAYSHHLESLIRAAGLEAALDQQFGGNANFARNWIVCKDWNEQSRYQVWTAQRAQALCDAVDDAADGVLVWLRTHW